MQMLTESWFTYRWDDRQAYNDIQQNQTGRHHKRAYRDYFWCICSRVNTHQTISNYWLENFYCFVRKALPNFTILVWILSTCSRIEKRFVRFCQLWWRISKIVCTVANGIVVVKNVMQWIDNNNNVDVQTVPCFSVFSPDMTAQLRGNISPCTAAVASHYSPNDK